MAIKVVRIIDRLNAGGPAKHVVWLTSGLRSADFQTLLITGTCARGETDMSYLAHAAGIEPLSIPDMSREISLRDLPVMMRLIRELFRFQPDIVHTHKSKAGTAGRIAALAYKWLTPSALRLRPRPCKVVHTYHGHIFHGYYGPAKTALFLSIERLLARFATDCIVVISPSQQREICERFGVGRRDQFRVIPLGLDLTELRRETGSRFRQELGVAPDELLIGTVGRLTEVKNHFMLLESAAELLRCGVRARLVIVGDGHLRDRLEQHAGHLGISDRVIFAGFRRDVLALYPALDIVALTSLNEGTPLTLIEAMAWGRPVAASEVGGVPDLLGTRQFTQEGFSVWDHGVSAPSRGVAQFALALRFLAEHSGLRAEMGARGRAFVECNFSRERLVRDVAQLYHELSGETGAGREPAPCESQPVEKAQAFSLHRAP
jgi:glycosyltransferase involved in cell wall biosynthesis